MNRLQRSTLIEFVCVPLVLGSLGYFSFWYFYPANTRCVPSESSVCLNNMRNVGLALHNYHETYDSFPPAYVVGPDGTPWHSWRTLLLPFLEQKQLYDLYDFSKPWNDPANQTLTHSIDQLEIYCCPSNPGNCSYFAVVGERTMWPGPTAMTFDQLNENDGLSRTIAFVESRNPQGHHWSEPYDLQYDDLQLTINPAGGGGISSIHAHSKVANAIFADGSGRRLPNLMTTMTLRKLLLIDNGHPDEAF